MYWKLKVIKRSDSRAGEALEFCEKNLLSNNFSLHFIVFSKIGFSYKHCNFTPICLPVKMASKTVIRPIHKVSLFKRYLRANVCNFRESVDSRDFLDFFIFCPNNLYGILISKITLKLVTAFYFFRNRTKF